MGSRLQNTIETDRLSLRPFQPDDDPATFGWFRDSLVMKYIPNGRDATFEQTRARLAGYRAHQDTHGFSKWLIVERASGRAIGDSGLYVLATEGWTDLGFRRGTTRQDHGHTFNRLRASCSEPIQGSN